MTLYLIRHGHTLGTEERRYYGLTDYPLTEAGCAEIAANRDAGVYPAPENKRFITSRLSRTHETLEIIYGAVPYTESAEINEINMGIYEGKRHEELMTTTEYPLWLDTYSYEQPYPGGESAVQLRDRAVPYLRSLMNGGDTVVVCHGGVISAAMLAWFGNPDDSFYIWLPEPSRGFAVYCENGAPVSYAAL